MEAIIKNGTIVSETGIFRADLGIQNGKIACISEKLEDGSARVYDADGCMILPGAIDAHVHLEMPSSDFYSADNYYDGTVAALCGGTTMIINYIGQDPKVELAEVIDNHLALAEGNACCDYSFHCCVTDLKNGRLFNEFEAMKQRGVTSIKCFTIYKNCQINDAQLVEVMKEANKQKILVNVHAENAEIVYANEEHFVKTGKTDSWHHYLSRPEFAEAEAVSRVIYFAEKLDVPVYIVHLACEDGVEMVRRAQQRGVRVYAETCPQYLEFTNEVYKQDNGFQFVCSPAIKGERSRVALWKGLQEGVISTVMTDHCPFSDTYKQRGREDFTKNPNGCPGIENRYPYLLSKASEGKISYEQVVSLCATQPAKLFGCERKGKLEVGRDADIVIYNPAGSHTISSKQMHSNIDYTIWEGVSVKGNITHTFLRGIPVYENGQFLGKKGNGKFVKRCFFAD